MKIRKTDMPENRDVILMQRRMEALEERFDQHQAAEEKRWSHLLSVTESNAAAISELTTAVRAQAASTHDVVEAYRDFQGVKRVGGAFGQFLKWASGLAVVGTFVVWLMKELGYRVG